VDSRLGLGPLVFSWRFTPAEQPRFVQVGVIWSVESGAGRVVRPAPALPQVVEVAQWVEMLLPARRKGVESPAGGEFHARDDEVQFVVSGVTVTHPQYVILIGLQPGEGGPLEVVHKPSFLLRRDLIFRPPGADAGAELPLAGLRVNQGAGQFLVAAQDLRRRFRTAGIVQPKQVIDRAMSAALSVREHFYVHG